MSDMNIQGGGAMPIPAISFATVQTYCAKAEDAIRKSPGDHYKQKVEKAQSILAAVAVLCRSTLANKAPIIPILDAHAYWMHKFSQMGFTVKDLGVFAYSPSPNACPDSDTNYKRVLKELLQLEYPEKPTLNRKASEKQAKQVFNPKKRMAEKGGHSQTLKSSTAAFGVSAFKYPRTLDDKWSSVE